MTDQGDATDDDGGGLEAVFAETVRRTGAAIGALYLLSADERLLCLDLLSGVPTELAEPWARVPVTAAAPVADAVREGRLVWLSGQEELASAYPRTATALPYPLALAAAPVTGMRRWGALLLLWPASRPPHMTARERGNIAASCGRLARLVEEGLHRGAPAPHGARPRIRAVATSEDVGGATGQAQAAADFTERLPGGSCALDLGGRITFLNSAACELLGRDAGQLLGTRPWESLRWLDDPDYEKRYRAAVIGRVPVAYTVLRPPDRWMEFRLYPDASGISVRIVPTAPRTADTGPDAGAATDTDSDGHTASASVVPDWAAASVPTTAEATRAGRLYQLTHLALALTEVVGVSDVIGLVADQIMPAFGAEGLVLSSAEAGRLRITGSRGYASDTVERLDGLPLDTRLTPAGHVLATGVPAFFSDPEEMRRGYPDGPGISGKQAWAFLPLVVSGRPVGVCVLSWEHRRAFPAEERAVLTSLAGLIAQALDRARLYDMKHDLAHGLQQALLPGRLPSIDGLRAAARYLPATRGMEIGGDFYDLIRLGDTAAGAVIGDVQGHNVAAAALMGQVRTAVRAHATLDASPDRVLSATNRLLVDLEPDLFTSCLYARLDFARGRVAFASAGHPPPLLRLPGRATRPLDVPPGPLLGIDPEAEFPVTEIPLSPGLTLAFYTDGLVESPGVDIDDAIARLAAELGPGDERDLDALVESLLSASGRRGQRTDDVALLLLHHTAGRG